VDTLKTLPAIAAVSIAMALLLVPLASVAAGSISFTSPASGASLKGSASYTISGSVSPAPTQADEVGIKVTNPANQIVDQDTATVTNGAFSYPTAVGGTASWTTGTYTISATDSFGATGTTTFTYTSSSGGSAYNVTAALIKIQKQLNQTLAQNAVLQKDLKGNETAEQTSLSSITSSLNSITSSLATITSNLNAVSTAVTGLQTSLTNIGNQISSMNTVVQGLGPQISNAVTQATNAANNASSVQTYVLVVAVLAAITLVLELAILVRKLS
jgi:hypothetical protein